MFPTLTCSSSEEIMNIYFLHLNHACPTSRTIRGIKLVFTKQTPLLMLPKKKKKSSEQLSIKFIKITEWWIKIPVSKCQSLRLEHKGNQHEHSQPEMYAAC